MGGGSPKIRSTNNKLKIRSTAKSISNTFKSKFKQTFNTLDIAKYLEI